MNQYDFNIQATNMVDSVEQKSFPNLRPYLQKFEVPYDKVEYLRFDTEHLSYLIE